jgi:REP element-mobilizing transposase RayT
MSSYLGLHYHLIFSTKNREPWITPDLRPKLHEYLGGTVRGLGGEPHGIGGVADHVHLLVSLKSTHCLADFMRELKKAATLWMQDTGNRRAFAWQDGYCALSVSPSGRNGVRAYIARQEEHHRVKTFREELAEFLHKAEIPYEERHWD